MKNRDAQINGKTPRNTRCTGIWQVSAKIKQVRPMGGVISPSSIIATTNTPKPDWVKAQAGHDGIQERHCQHNACHDIKYAPQHQIDEDNHQQNDIPAYIQASDKLCDKVGQVGYRNKPQEHLGPHQKDHHGGRHAHSIYQSPIHHIFGQRPGKKGNEGCAHSAHGPRFRRGEKAL